MSRWHITAAVLALALGLVVIVGCGGDDDDDKSATDATNTAAARDAEKAAREAANLRIREEARKRRGKKRKPTAAERATARRRAKQRAAALRKRDKAADREFDRDFEKGFEESGFDKLVAKLPLRRPPLHVQQFITTGPSHRIYTAVERRRFLCRMSPAERRKAVAGYFRTADKIMRDGGVDDFVQVVTLTSDTAEDLPALAEARNGSVTLKGQGRERDPC